MKRLFLVFIFQIIFLSISFCSTCLTKLTDEFDLKQYFDSERIFLFEIKEIITEEVVTFGRTRHVPTKFVFEIIENYKGINNILDTAYVSSYSQTNYGFVMLYKNIQYLGYFDNSLINYEKRTVELSPCIKYKICLKNYRDFQYLLNAKTFGYKGSGKIFFGENNGRLKEDLSKIDLLRFYILKLKYQKKEVAILKLLKNEQNLKISLNFVRHKIYKKESRFGSRYKLEREPKNIVNFEGRIKYGSFEGKWISYDKNNVNKPNFIGYFHNNERIGEWEYLSDTKSCTIFDKYENGKIIERRIEK